MFRVVNFILVCNLVAFLLIYGVEKFTGFFGLSYISDYAFFVAAMIWSVAALWFFYPPEAGYGSDRVDRQTKSMIDTSVADAIDEQRGTQNMALCIKLFIAGIPAFLVCLLSGSYFS